LITKPRGTNDILPSEVHKWHFVERVFQEVCETFGFEEMRTPTFEYTNLFQRGVGETTDIVQKEMFNVIPSIKIRTISESDFTTTEFENYLNKEGLTLKPEGTASIVRAFTENKIYGLSSLNKIYYITACFRHERPQKGRMREFHQFGIETFGTMSPSADAEVIALADAFLRRLGLTNIELHINSIGCPTCRPQYDEILKAYLKPKLPELCATCNDRYEKNPMRILDCKNERCQNQLKDAPKMLDHLCDECSDHFSQLQSMLRVMNVPFQIDENIVRGLDYYTKTAFEFISKDIGAQSAVCGGGRYDGLIEEIGDIDLPGVGFGMGIERLLLTLEENNIAFDPPTKSEVFIIVLGEKAKIKATGLAQRLRLNGIKTELDHLDRSLKAQFKYANKIKVPYVIVMGEEEVKNDEINLKKMSDGTQITVPVEDIVTMIEFIKA